MTCLSIIRVFCSVFLQFLATLIGGLAVEWQKAVTAHQSPISDHPARHIWSPRCLCSCLHHISAGFTFFLKTQTTSHIISSAYGRNIMNGNKTSLIFMFKASQASVCFLEGFKNILAAYKKKHNEWLFLVQLYNINIGMLPYYCDSCTFQCLHLNLGHLLYPAFNILNSNRFSFLHPPLALPFTVISSSSSPAVTNPNVCGPSGFR